MAKYEAHSFVWLRGSIARAEGGQAEAKEAGVWVLLSTARV
jgi:hypothetical protein